MFLILVLLALSSFMSLAAGFQLALVEVGSFDRSPPPELGRLQLQAGQCKACDSPPSGASLSCFSLSVFLSLQQFDGSQPNYWMSGVLNPEI
mmetsp:Transcript_8390/g.12796  ORF Transcript_8390/g.12796 Transcript_8390/m.12796 type:complete len:92 (+) Transcript_8390:160-435(+)